MELKASLAQFRNKGRLKVGADADIIAFDPAAWPGQPAGRAKSKNVASNNSGAGP